MSLTTILSQLFSEDITLKKISETESSDVWGDTTQTTKTYTIKGYVIPITLEDLRWLPTGKYTAGDARGYFYTTYQIGTEEVEVRPSDLITYNGIEYEVDFIGDYTWNFSYREAYLRRIIE